MTLFTSQAMNWLCVILEERFGHSFMLIQDQNSLKLTLANSSLRYILFPELETAFHESRSDFPCTQWDATQESWVSVLDKSLPAPCVNELHYPLIEPKEDHYLIHYDILGLTYWMLNRIEEIGRTDLDIHQRFPAVSSHAFKYNYLERPIVDEWLNILGQVIQRVWPEVKLKKHGFHMCVSHDVDTPSLYAFQPWKNVFRMMAGHLLKRRDLKAFLQAPYIKLTSINTLSNLDPFNTFEWLMEKSEANNIKSAFYFICGRTDPGKDADYEIEHPIMRSLIKKIYKRGHEVGLHPSYNTYLKPHLIKQESMCFKKVCLESGIQQAFFGGRMHYLRWQHPSTMKSWADAGMSYDSTLGYADRPGFRCGTCFEYPAFNPVSQERISLRIRPLIAMESTFIEGGYMSLSNTEISILLKRLKNLCSSVGGTFTLLWHNSSLTSDAHRELYEEALESLV